MPTVTGLPNHISDRHSSSIEEPHSQAYPVFVFQFALIIIHRSGSSTFAYYFQPKLKNKKWGTPLGRRLAQSTVGGNIDLMLTNHIFNSEQ